VKDALHTQALRNLNEHGRVIDIDSSRGCCLGYVKSEPEDLDVRLPHSDETRRDESVDE
jgi:hypothetical protein